MDRGTESINCDDERFGAISNIVGIIAHDFNNLLTPFLAYPQLIKNDLPEGAGGHALLDAMEKTAKDMVHITQQLLDFSSKDGMGHQTVNMNNVVSDVLSVSKNNGSIPQGVSVDAILAPDLKKISGACDQLMRAVYNLSMNALEAMPAGGKLTIRTENVKIESGGRAVATDRKDGEFVKIGVSDTGSGVPDRIKNQIFNPFFTTKKGAQRRGAGLGLCVVYRVVRSHGGHIDFQSEPEKGSTFNMYFPVEKGPVASAISTDGSVATAEVQPAVDQVACSKDRVLVVDDERTILRLFQMILSSALAGCKIDVASNGEEGVRSFMDGHHSVLVMDLHMPIMDGQAAFAKIEHYCKENRWEMPSVVFCTCFAPPDSVRDVTREGSKHCLLSKPVSGEILVEAVKSRFRQ